MSGTVAKTLQDKDKVIIRPENGKVVRLKYRPEKVEVTLEGKAAKPDAISEGQKATVEYVKKTNKKDREVNIAKSIELKSATGAKHGGETTGWRLAGDGGTGGVDLDVSKVEAEAKRLDGKRVTVTGQSVDKKYVERGTVRLLKVEKIEEAR